MLPKDPSEYSKDEAWIPNLKQEAFLSLPLTIKEAFYGGGAGSGKSDVLLYYPIVWGFHHNPRFKQVFMRRTFPELRNEIVPRSRDIYRRFGATFNKADMAWTFPRPDQAGGTGLTNDGAVIYLGHCEHEDDVHKYDSMEINLFTPDELTSFTLWIYTYIGFQRVRTSDPKLPAIIRSAGMPGNIGHTWVNNRFVKPYPQGGKILIGQGNIKRIFIFATQADNPHIDPTYAASLAALPEAEKNAKLYGSFDAYLGQVFDEFRDRHYQDEPENALHVVEPFDIPDFWPKIIVGDWGYKAMTYIAFGAIAPSGRVYIYRELNWKGLKIEEWAQYIKVYLDSDKPKVIKFCKSVGQDRGQEHTIQQQIEEALGRPIELSNNAPGTRVAGKILLHEYLRWKQKHVIQREKMEYNEVHAAWLYRNKGIDAYKEYLELFNPPKEEQNIPKLQIFNTCPLLINAIKSCVYAKDREGIPSEDVAEFEGDDPYDTIRYMVDSADRYFAEAKEEFDRLEKHDIILQQLRQTQDYTAFYRNSRTLESEGRVGAIRRYRH